jgi:hypothetical protein
LDVPIVPDVGARTDHLSRIFRGMASANSLGPLQELGLWPASAGSFLLARLAINGGSDHESRTGQDAGFLKNILPVECRLPHLRVVREGVRKSYQERRDASQNWNSRSGFLSLGRPWHNVVRSK